MLASLRHSSTSKIKEVYNRLKISQCHLCHQPAQISLCSDCFAGLPRLSLACPLCAEPNEHGHICGQCLKEPPDFQRVLIPYRYEFPINHLLKGWKFRHQRQHDWLIHTLAKHLQEHRFDAITPIPSHWRRRLWRGRDHSLEIAKVLAEQLELPIIQALARSSATPSQRGLDKVQRQRNLRSAFTLNSSMKGLNILLVDDVMTTGSTVNMASKALQKGQPKSITVACIARTPSYLTKR